MKKSRKQYIMPENMPKDIYYYMMKELDELIADLTARRENYSQMYLK